MANETKNETAQEVEARPFPAIVSRIVDEYTIVINRGNIDGLRKGQKFLVYGIEEAVIDPETNESLGYLEIVRGRGVVSHVQAKMATLKSDEKYPSKVVKKRNLGLLSMGTEVVEESENGTLMPFEEAQVGDKAKPL